MSGATPRNANRASISFFLRGYPSRVVYFRASARLFRRGRAPSAVRAPDAFVLASPRGGALGDDGEPREASKVCVSSSPRADARPRGRGEANNAETRASFWFWSSPVSKAARGTPRRSRLRFSSDVPPSTSTSASSTRRRSRRPTPGTARARSPARPSERENAGASGRAGCRKRASGRTRAAHVPAPRVVDDCFQFVVRSRPALKVLRGSNRVLRAAPRDALLGLLRGRRQSATPVGA